MDDNNALSQRAAVAVELLPELTQSAKQRQLAGLKQIDDHRSGKNTGTADVGESRDQAAALVGVSPRYVSDAAKLKQESPEAFQLIAFFPKSGDQEPVVHKRLSHLRVQGEWFRYTAEVSAVIKEFTDAE